MPSSGSRAIWQWQLFGLTLLNTYWTATALNSYWTAMWCYMLLVRKGMGGIMLPDNSWAQCIARARLNVKPGSYYSTELRNLKLDCLSVFEPIFSGRKSIFTSWCKHNMKFQCFSWNNPQVPATTNRKWGFWALLIDTIRKFNFKPICTSMSPAGSNENFHRGRRVPSFSWRR
jgi:hypothetical protein